MYVHFGSVSDEITWQRVERDKLILDASFNLSPVAVRVAPVLLCLYFLSLTTSQIDNVQLSDLDAAS
jgi:hypothetical protein